MERLTKRIGNGLVCLIDGKHPCDIATEALKRLAAYEDTGLTPEEVELYREAQEISESMEPGRLVELAQAEKDGRLVVIPCKIGDVVWAIKNFKGHKRVRVGYVSEMHYTKDMKLYIVVKGLSRGFWGKDVFATQEEATAAVERITMEEAEKQ